VVLVTIDTLRSRSIGAYGYSRAQTPNIDRLAAEGLLFENAYTPVPQTGPSHASILTGLHPARHGVLYNGWRLAEHFLTLAEILKANGYETIGAVSVEHITTPFGFAQGFDQFIDQNPLFDRFYSVGPNTGAHFSLVDMLRNPKLRHREASRFNPNSHQRTGDLTMDLVEDALEERGEGPFFLWLHLFDPHKPYQAPERYAAHFRKTEVTLPETPFPQDETRERFDLYDSEVAFTDVQIGRLLKALGSTLDDTLIVFTADHGESLGEHGRTGHSSHVTEEVAKVPLILRMPGRIPEGERETKRVFTMDIAPTILSFLDLPVAHEMNGEDIFTLEPGRPLFFQCESPSGFRLYGVLAGALKAVFTWSPEVDKEDWSLAKKELYDIENDSDEKKNLAAGEGETQYLLATRVMGDDTRAFYSDADVPMQEIDPATKQALEALGYVQ
jgi:arylsulfatase A-like enzyme